MGEPWRMLEYMPRLVVTYRLPRRRTMGVTFNLTQAEAALADILPL